MRCQILDWSNKTTQKIITLFVVASSIPAECSSSRSHLWFLVCFDGSNRKGLQSYVKGNASTQNLLLWSFCCIIDNNQIHLNNTAELMAFIRWITIHPDLWTQMTFLKHVSSEFHSFANALPLPTYPTTSPAYAPVLANREVCNGPADTGLDVTQGQKHTQNCRVTYESKGISQYF